MSMKPGPPFPPTDWEGQQNPLRHTVPSSLFENLVHASLFCPVHRYYELAHSVQEEIVRQPMYLRPPPGATLREYQVGTGWVQSSLPNECLAGLGLIHVVETVSWGATWALAV
jgi:hypothetical protein